ncbi:MAG TPA: nucleotide sugar dehydrogenase [Sphingomicrobium sp.]|jgi:UDP-N-acetyl-D-galactosamine dehydrogenase
MRAERVAVVGLGYVGLPLAVAMAKKGHDVLGFDVSTKRIAALRSRHDWTNEISEAELSALALPVSDDPADMRGRSIFIVTVPTPIDDANRPDFAALLSACELLGPVLTEGCIVVFESTVYPGVTEDICAPALEKSSGLKAGRDFTLGYSPERINPGDREHPIEKITKVVAGQDADTLRRLADLYGSVIEAGIHQAQSIKVAEAAKVIENTQRDVNIALMNEISKICDLVGIRTADVLAAAGTKWNFLKFYPGLVGGHCIGVDPYYLTAKAEQLGYHPQVILSGRRINDGMGAYVGQRIVKMLAQAGLPLQGARVGILGFTFKENVPDIRNSKVIDIYNELRAFGLSPMVHDPLADAATIKGHYGVELSRLEDLHSLHALVLAVPHSDYAQLDAGRLSGMISEGGVFIDIKSAIDPAAIRCDISVWGL